VDRKRTFIRSRYVFRPAAAELVVLPGVPLMSVPVPVPVVVPVPLMLVEPLPVPVALMLLPELVPALV